MPFHFNQVFWPIISLGIDRLRRVSPSCLVLLLFITQFSLAQQNGESGPVKGVGPASLTDSVAPKPLTLNQLIRKNEDYFHSLQTAIIRLQRNPNLEIINEDIPIIEGVVERIMQSFYSGEIEFNLQYLSELDNLLSGYNLLVTRWRSEVDSRAETFTQIGDNIEVIKNTYQSATSMVDSSALPALNEQWAALLRRLTRADSLFSVQNINNLDVQTKLSALSVGISDAKDEIREQQRTIRSAFFQKDSPFIWQLRSLRELPTLYPVIEESILLNQIILRTYWKRNLNTFIWVVILGIGIYGWFFYLVNRIKKEKEFSKLILDRNKYLTKSPLTCAILSMFTLAPYVLPYPPNGLILGVLIATTICTSLLIKQVLIREVFRMWIFLAISLIVFGTSNLIIEQANQERWYLIVFSVFGLYVGARSLSLIQKKPDQYPAYLKYLIYLYLTMQVTSVVLHIVGRFSLAKMLGVGATLSVTQGISLYLFVTVIMEALYLQVELLQGNTKEYTNYLDYKAIYKRLSNFFIFLALIMWSFFLALNLSIDDFIIESISHFLTETREIGSTSFTFRSIFIFIFVIWASSMLAKNIAYFVSIRDSEKADGRNKRLGSSVLLIRLAVLIVGFFFALAFSGISLDNLTIILGGLSVGIAFGLQTIVNNLASGIILAFERPIQIGDAIEVGGRSGVVKEVGIRSSTIQAYDGSEVIIPNGDLLSQHLINWTLSDRRRRIELIIGVAYGSDLKQVQTVLEEVLQKNDLMKIPAPKVLIHHFADSAVEFRLLFWVSNFDTWIDVRNQVLSDTFEAFKQAGIEIPFPQRDLHLKSGHLILPQTPNTNTPKGTTEGDAE
ncbi:MAG: mechanosensitive ion channel [Lunatimonas sp.]|uniref:mechanosensitive ion channel family protein n=1 Tax=Lunatimonas sp. TaxID=2060141 RepID=UPI00263BABB7|nr:mechanosensitive ion channel domain-containing protein [Lunatimonas sp.]MCC5936364.1 mechanosensitive ion channel [Lunatimonas sp.]